MAGVLDVGTILRRPAKWFREWEIYYELEPFGEMPANYRAASICQLIANVNRGKNQKAYKLEDFVLKFGMGEPKREQSVQEKLNVMTLIMRAYAEAQAEGHANAAIVNETAKEHGVTL